MLGCVMAESSKQIRWKAMAFSEPVQNGATCRVVVRRAKPEAIAVIC
jgi:hypothetical protein